MNRLYQKLKTYSESDYYGFHMPGHKRNTTFMAADLPYGIDITEIDGFDDLHHADGILKEAQERTARVYHAEESHFLINGSTAGLLSAILGSTRKNDTVLVARNCHKSVYHAIYMNELHPVYLYPEFSDDLQLNTELSVETVEKALSENPEAKAVIMVSPTYDGVISDIEGIARTVHRRKIPLIVDEAHGAHLGFSSYFGKNANQKGADIVIHSLHKTLPALTQTAVLHMNGKYANREKVRMYLHMIQTSSPSYVLMASIDECIMLLQEHGKEVFEDYEKRLICLRTNLQHLKHLRILETEHFDSSKIVISVKGTNITSSELYDTLLEKYHLQMEMLAGSYVIAMTSMADTKEGFQRLEHALQEIDSCIEFEQDEKKSGRIPEAVQILNSAETYRMVEKHPDQRESRGWQEAKGMISTEYAYLYPPGIPLIVPGEEITEDVILTLEQFKKNQFTIEGLSKEGCIEVLKNG